MSDLDDIFEDLKQKRDELRLQMHLASKEAKDEWDELEEKMEEFSEKAKLDETGQGVGKALGQLGHEIKLGYERLWTAVKD
jgi:vacuolar-type H+-ATPase subunit D/Vma8